MIKYKYRIKTEEEFLKEFGENWRSIYYSFSNSMDFLLDMEIEDDVIIKSTGGEIQCLSLKNKLNLDVIINNKPLYFKFKGWTISFQMIKEIKKPEYNEKKTLVYD